MAKLELPTKKLQIDKAQATIVTVIASAVFITIFSLVSAKSLWTQRAYQSRVIGKKKEARKVLQDNVKAVQDLASSYQTFVQNPVNMLGGNPNGSGPLDGDNARLVLDALPSKYDFPALTSSLEKILTERNFSIDGISGSDDEIAQSSAVQSGDPTPVEIPFSLSVSGSSASIQDLISVFEHSIRPFNVQSISLSGGEGDMAMALSVKTYYQPEKALNIKTEPVK